MRVIVATGLNTGPAEYRNLGDIAMLQVAVARLLGLWPAARIEVLTESPSNLARYCPDALPLPRAGCACWVDDRVLLGRCHRFLPKWLSVRLSAWKQAAGMHWPALLALLIRLRLDLRDRTGRGRDFQLFLQALKKADLLVVCGSGGFADSCQDWNLSILGTVEAALRRGIPVAMFGQGMGPLNDPLVLTRARCVLPKVNLLALRGTSGGLSLLESLGVPADRVLITGDDAIEFAHSERRKEFGCALGINLRVAPYAGVRVDAVEVVRAAMQRFARRYNAPLLPLPIALHDGADDRQAIRQLLAGFDDASDGGEALHTPSQLIEQTARCRVVVTGAYHAAVFALAQGIPAVCLSNSPYYLAKFQGLKDLFEVGCTVIPLSQPDLSGRLETAIEHAWTFADAARGPLLRAAVRQIEAGRAAYQRVEALLHPEPRRTRPFLPVRA